jgi:hypothetical protein
MARVIAAACVVACSAGDDGLGGIDDTDDITGIRGALSISRQTLSRIGGIGATAAATARLNMNALAVRLALPLAAAGSDMEGMAAEKAQVRQNRDTLYSPGKCAAPLV